MTQKMWGGRFSEEPTERLQEFNASVHFDHRLYAYDIAGSKAHATMLAKIGVLTQAENELIQQGLTEIEQEISTGKFKWQLELEDVHMNIEARLTEKIGYTGKKLHTGRSRNDQVATDIRLYLRDQIDQIDELLTKLQQVLLTLAEQQADTIMPGFTHLQTAQPVTFGHHMLAWYEMIKRDQQRFQDCRKRVNQSPLGAAALAGTTFPIDREMTAKALGFEQPMANSLDAVSDRDFVIEFISNSSQLMIHLSRWSEELILWSTAQFNFIELPDQFCTGSSIMPQKKNPDIPELIRGKSGRVTGNLMSLLMLMKGQPLAYNKDNQEDKEPLFDTVDTVINTLHIVTDMLPTMKVNTEALYQAAQQGYATATDLADYLVRKNIPFRDAHKIVGQAVKLAITKHCDLVQIPLNELQNLSDKIEKDVFDILTLEGSVSARNHLGGTAPKQIKAAIAKGRKT